MHFQFRLGKATYSIFEVCLQTLFFLMACGCFVWWCLYAFSAPLRLWTLHHVWTTVLVTVMLAYFRTLRPLLTQFDANSNRAHPSRIAPLGGSDTARL